MIKVMRIKLSTLAVIMLCLQSVTAYGQVEDKTYKENFDNKDKNLIEQARGEASKISRKLGNLISGEKPDEDLVKIKGSYYMRIYRESVYRGDDAEQYRSKCLGMFTNRYPMAKIVSVAIPQTDWLTEWVMKGKAIAGNAQVLYCFILAQDDQFGYINAKFIFKKYKQEGGEYMPLADSWPRWERMDYITPEIYVKLESR